MTIKIFIILYFPDVRLARVAHLPGLHSSEEQRGTENFGHGKLVPGHFVNLSFFRTPFIVQFYQEFMLVNHLQSFVVHLEAEVLHRSIHAVVTTYYLATDVNYSHTLFIKLASGINCLNPFTRNLLLKATVYCEGCYASLFCSGRKLCVSKVYNIDHT